MQNLTHLSDPRDAPVSGWALARVQDTNTTVLEGPQFSSNAKHYEIWLRDLDGYLVVVAGKSATQTG